MTKFEELLSKPLPSAQKQTSVTESAEDLLDNDNPAITEPDEPTPAPVEDPELPPVTDTPAPAPADDDEVAPDLTPEESRRVDDTMDTVASTMLLKSELNSEEAVREFVESVDCDIAEAEGFLTERTVVRFDKNARKAQLYEVAVAACAREKNDRLFKKLQFVYAMERRLKAKLRKKYDVQAQKKVKEYIARAKKSKSGVLARIINKITGK
jgi:hypothetical protein